MSVDSDDEELVFEPDAVSMWIANELERLGFSSMNAWLIAANRLETDWHKAVDLLQQGVDQDLILRILI